MNPSRHLRADRPHAPSRRGFLRGLLGLSVLFKIAPARAFGRSSHMDVAEVNLGPGTTSRPTAWRTLLFEVERTTSIVVESHSVLVDPATPELFEHPFSVLLVDGAFAMPDDLVIEHLSAYLAYGGFLFIDDTTGGSDPDADQAVRQLLTRLFPTHPLAWLPADHAINRSFFLLKSAPGRVDRAPTLEAVTVGSLCPVVYGRNDLSGALWMRESGAPMLSCVPGGESQRREARKVALNLVMYAMTANYKKDQAHVQELLRSRNARQGGRLPWDDTP